MIKTVMYPALPKPITVVLGGMDQVYMAALRQLLRNSPEVGIIKTVWSLAELADFRYKHPHSLAILDVMLRRNVCSLAFNYGLVKRKQPYVLYVHSFHPDDIAMLCQLLRFGSGVVNKCCSVSGVLNAIWQVAEGIGIVVEPQYRSRLIDYWQGEHSDPLFTLSPCQFVVYVQWTHLMNYNEISSYLMLSPKTIENHRAKICGKLHLPDSAALRCYAIRRSVCGNHEQSHPALAFPATD